MSIYDLRDIPPHSEPGREDRVSLQEVKHYLGGARGDEVYRLVQEGRLPRPLKERVHGGSGERGRAYGSGTWFPREAMNQIKLNETVNVPAFAAELVSGFIERLQRLPVEAIRYGPGIYFLLSGEEIVYVGRSSKCCYRRVLQHVDNGIKEFDGARWLQLDEADTTIIEQLFVKLLQPPLNGSGTSRGIVHTEK